MVVKNEWAIARYATGTVNGFDNAVTTVWFSVFAYDDIAPVGKRGRFDGQVALSPPAEGSVEFLEPQNADRSHILDWTKAALGESGVSSAEAKAIAEYETAAEPSVVTF